MSSIPQPAPDWQVDRWFNAANPIDLASLCGRVIVFGAFQMLCPGCVAHLVPQLREVRKTFAERDVAVIGLHTVFEHHAAMTPVSLEAFLKEYQVTFPVGVDRLDSSPVPVPLTMRAYAMRGTPTTVLIDRQGRLRTQTFGHMPDLRLGAEIAALLRDTADERADVAISAPQSERATCRVG